MSNGMGSHQSAKMMNDEWLTPLSIIKALGEFDLDPCAPIVRPWEMAKVHFTKEDDGLKKDWFGRVWCNPPYGLQATNWLEKLSGHGNGIALIFARTETEMFFKWVWHKADAVRFIKGRLSFYDVLGEKAKANSGAPSCLIAYGKENAELLMNCSIPGVCFLINKNY